MTSFYASKAEYTPADLSLLIGCHRVSAGRVFRRIWPNRNKKWWRLNPSEWAEVLEFLKTPQGLKFGRHNPFRIAAQELTKSKEPVYFARDVKEAAQVSYYVVRHYLLLVGITVPRKKAKMNKAQFAAAVAALQECAATDSAQPLRALGVSGRDVRRAAV